jgi:hypothetical protein
VMPMRRVVFQRAMMRPSSEKIREVRGFREDFVHYNPPFPPANPNPPGKLPDVSYW